MHPMG